MLEERNVTCAWTAKRPSGKPVRNVGGRWWCARPGDTEEAVLRRGGDMEAVMGSTLGGKEVHRHVPLGQEQMTSLSPRRAAIH